jgi:hypothetical protein
LQGDFHFSNSGVKGYCDFRMAHETPDLN